MQVPGLPDHESRVMLRECRNQGAAQFSCSSEKMVHLIISQTCITRTNA
jgi:hypothetical protein